MAEFDYFPADTANPIGKYTQPKPIKHPPGLQEDTGYPQTEVKDGGITIRSGKAQTKGRKAVGTMGGRS